MKDNKVGKNKVGPSTTNSVIDAEREKSSFEKFEDEIKSTIFNVLYVLLKDDETSHWKHIVLILFDFFQIYYFPFDEQLTYPWRQENVLYYVQTFLQFFQIKYWLAKLDFTTYLVFFYVSIFIVCLVILDIFYVSYSFQKKKFSFVWPLQALRSVCGLFVTVLFLPFLETFTSMIHCEDVEGVQVNILFQDVECWHGMHIIHATFSIVVSFIFIIICLIVSLTYFDTQSSSHDISARVNSRADVFVVLLKIILTYLYVFVGKDQYQWILIAMILILSFTAYSNFRYHWPYYNDKMNKFFCVLTGILLWSSLVLFIAKILENTEFSGALELYFLGLPLIIGLITFDKDERIKLLLKNINNFQKGEEVSLQIRYFLYLIQTKDHNRKNAIILKGYIYHHEDSCPNSDCQLKQYKNGLLQNSKSKKNGKKHAQMSQSFDNYQLLLQHAKNMYRIGIQKFPNCTSLKIQYAFFLMERMNKKTEAIFELSQASLYNPPFDEQFIIFRYKKMSEDFGDNPHDSNSGGLDVVAKFAYESSLRQLQQHIEKSASLHLEFWNYLREDRPDIAKLNQTGSKINQSIIMVEQYWSQLQKLNSNAPKALKLYAKFLIEILNDKEGGQDLLSRAKDATNVKQNYYDANNIHDDANDINSMSANGTPCIYVSGDSDKIGLINNCNLGSCRIFGYTFNEMRNHQVEKLMPEMYAKNHSKILDDALAKGPENIPNKERLVFARHKSGYLFPVWLQLKMVSSAQSGVQFVALFKIDKKVMSSSIAYILINKEKKIQGISSSCMKLMGLDIPKMRKLFQSGIDINKIAPSLFESDHNNEYQYTNKQGGILDWYMPDFDKVKKTKEQNQARWGIDQDNSSKSIPEPAQKRVLIGDQKMQFACHLNPINMGELGEVGWYLKLESAAERQRINNPTNKKEKDKERVKQPLFQFRYDAQSGKFVRELRENSFIDTAIKNPNFINGKFMSILKNLPQDAPSLSNNLVQHKGDEEKSGADPDEVKAETDEDKLDSPTTKKVNESVSEELFERKRKWGKGIAIYKLMGGKFLPKDYDEDIKKQQQIEEERRRKEEDEQKANQNVDVFKNHIKSRKALQTTINDKSTPRAIRNLRITMNLVIFCLLALAITEFTVINSQFNDINDNFNLIQMSYGRVSEIQRIAYNVRTLVLFNNQSQDLSIFGQYTTMNKSTDEFVNFFQNDTEDALNNLYTLQNTISLSSLSMSSSQQELINTKSVNLYFMNNGNSLKILQFSLTEAVLQIASSVFTVRNLNISSYNSTQEDVYFITYNSYNDFLEDLRKSSLIYEEDLNNRATQKNELIMILFLSSIGTLIITMLILFPVVSNVNMARMKVLSLFVDIPNHHVVALSAKCERFITSFLDEHNDEIESEDGDNVKVDESDVTSNPMNKRGGHKIPKNSTRSNRLFFIQFGVAVLVVMAYFSAMFGLSIQYINNIQVLTKEMNILAQAESYYSFTQNTIREMINDNTKPILNQNSFTVAKDTIDQLYLLNEKIQEVHFQNLGVLKQNYIDLFNEVFQDNLCGQIDLSLMPQDCNSFIATSATHGLQTVLVRYFETLKEVMKVYVLYLEKGYNPKNLLDSEYFLELYIIQFRFIQTTMREFVSTLQSTTNSDFQSRIDTRMAAFIIFVIGLVISYLVLWTPFVNKLNNEIWRTKSMLTIIPIEVIMKIPRIQEFLHSQSFFTNKSQNQAS